MVVKKIHSTKKSPTSAATSASSSSSSSSKRSSESSSQEEEEQNKKKKMETSRLFFDPLHANYPASSSLSLLQRNALDLQQRKKRQHALLGRSQTEIATTTNNPKIADSNDDSGDSHESHWSEKSSSSTIAKIINHSFETSSKTSTKFVSAAKQQQQRTKDLISKRKLFPKFKLLSHRPKLTQLKKNLQHQSQTLQRKTKTIQMSLKTSIQRHVQLRPLLKYKLNFMTQKTKTSMQNLDSRFGISDSVVGATCTSLILSMMGLGGGVGAGVGCGVVGNAVKNSVAAVVFEGIKRERERRKRRKRCRREYEDVSCDGMKIFGRDVRPRKKRC